MKTIDVNNNCPLNEDPDFTVEEIETLEGTQAGSQKGADLGEGSNPSPYRRWRYHIALALLLICLLFAFAAGQMKKDPPKDGSFEGTAEETVSVTEAENYETKETAVEDKNAGKEEKGETAISAQLMEQTKGEDLSWQAVIFGDHENGIVSYPITIQGLTENEKNLTGFRESDFVRSLSSFLSMNNIKTSAVTFSGSIACSAGEAAAYLAKMKGVDDRSLIVLFFPKYPGKYLFALEDIAEEKKEESVKKPETVTPSQSVNLQTQPSVPSVQTQPQSENSYDAMSLTLSGISSELGNYLSNPYELQYSLYDYLYNKGIRSAKSASVKSYYIDSEDRSATIQIEIAGIGSVTAIYDPGNNEYSFQ